MQDILTLVEQHKPMIFGIGEANLIADQDINLVQIPDYNLHVASSIKNPNMRIARVVVYTHKKLVIKRREDKEDPEVQAIFLEGGLAHQKKTLWIMAYRQWKLVSVAGQGQRMIGIPGTDTIIAQEDRWDKMLNSWNSVLQEGREVVAMMDSNLDHTTWSEEQHNLPRHFSSVTHKALIERLATKVFCEGVVNMVEGNTWHRGPLRAGLDQVYSNKPEKLSPVELLWTGMSDHALLKTNRWSKTVPNTARYVKKRSFKNFDPEVFKERVQVMPEIAAIMVSESVEEASKLLTKGLTNILDVMAPLKTVQTRQNYAPHMSNETKDLQSRREVAQAKAVVSGNPEDSRDYRSLRNQTLANLREDRKRWEQ